MDLSIDIEQLSLAELKAKTPAALLELAEQLEIENASSMRKGDMMFAILKDMAEEGVTQVFRPLIGAHSIVGVVGPLQLDVLASRMDKEYGVPIRYEPAPFVTARWISAEDRAQIDKFIDLNRSSVAEDRDGALVFLARNAWALDQARQDWPALSFAETRERG